MIYRPIEKREKNGEGRVLAFASVIAALALIYLPPGLQKTPAHLVRSTALRPFILAQEALVKRQIHSLQVDTLRSRVDSLLAIIVSQQTLEEENIRMKRLLQLTERMPYDHASGNVMRPGTPGSEGLFLLDVGVDQGVTINNPVISDKGLLGMIQEVQESSSLGMDWSHFQFRVSAMTQDGSIYGLVRSDPGGFREADRLLIDGIPFHQELSPGTVLVTSGLGGVYPRGIPLGKIASESESSVGWRRSYWVIPFVYPGEAVHVVVISPDDELSIYEDSWGTTFDLSGNLRSEEMDNVSDSIDGD